MKIQIVDSNHIILVASDAEVSRYSNYTGILIDNKDSFVCNSEPSSSAYRIERPIGGSLFNVSINISNSPFTTDELLILYIELDDATYPYVIPCYNNEQLMTLIADKSGVLNMKCYCLTSMDKVSPIVMYYGFKLALSLLDIQTAITYWTRLMGFNSTSSNCNCNGH